MIFGGDEYPDMDNGGESSEDSMDLSDDEEGTSKPEPIEKKSKVDQHSKREVLMNSHVSFIPLERLCFILVHSSVVGLA